MNRKVLPLEAAGQLHVPETDCSHVVYPTEPSQLAASIKRPASALVIGFMGRPIATILAFGSAVLSAALPCYGGVLFEGHTAIECGSAYLVPA